MKRAKLYYLRDRKGKSARIAEKIKKRIGVDVSAKVIDNEIVEEESKKENLAKDKDVALKAEPKKEKLINKKK